MAETGEWQIITVEESRPGQQDPGIAGDGDTQTRERRRRLICGSKLKTGKKYIQDIITFLNEEAAAAEEEVKWEQKAEESGIAVRLTLGGDSVEARSETLKAAKEVAAMQMLIKIGPYLEEAVWEESRDAMSDCVREENKHSWLPPLFDARHLPPDEDSAQPPLYEIEVQLGPISVISVSENLGSALESLTRHTTQFLKTRDLPALLREPTEEQLKEMEVFSHLNQPYVQTPGVLEVRMESSNTSLVIPPVDVFVMQKHLPDGKFPPQYGGQDVFGCRKVFWCHLSSQKIIGVENLLSHIQSIKYWRRLGKIFVNGQLRETFLPGAQAESAQLEGEEVVVETPAERQQRLSCTPKLCQTCLDSKQRKVAAYWNKNSYEYFCLDCYNKMKNPRLEKLPTPTVIHPMKDQDVEKDNLKYLISVYRCVDQLVAESGGTRSGPPSLMEMNVSPSAGSPYKPPIHNGAGFGGLYEEAGGGGGRGFKSGWEDPYSPKMGWEDPGQAQFGFGRGGGRGGPFPSGGYGGPMGYGGQMGYGGYGPMGGFGGQMGPRNRWNAPRLSAPAPADPESVGLKRKITAEKKLEKYSQGEIIMPESEEEVQEAYTGKVGKTGFSEKNKKETARYAALPPPGHSQWNKISGNENFKIDNSMANLKPVGANFKANKTGVRVCIPWKRGMCKLGDRCNYNHGDPQQMKLQSLVDAKISPMERDLSGYRIAADNSSQAEAGGGANKLTAPLPPTSNTKAVGKEESVSDDWFSAGTTEVKMRSTDKDAIVKSIQSAKLQLGGMETDFTQVKKKSKWD